MNELVPVLVLFVLFIWLNYMSPSVLFRIVVPSTTIIGYKWCSVRAYFHLFGMCLYSYLLTYNVPNEISISDYFNIVLQLYDGIYYWSRKRFTIPQHLSKLPVFSRVRVAKCAFLSLFTGPFRLSLFTGPF